MKTLLLVAFLIQDPVEDNLNRLSDKDPAVREAATFELMKTPLDQIGRIEKRLKDPEVDVAARARRIMTVVLKSGVGLRPSRFELRRVAPPDVMQPWVKAGADPKTPPKGYTLVRYSEKAAKPSDYPQDWIPVEDACITSEDVMNAEASPEAEMPHGPKSWQVNLQFTEAGAAKFDAVAEDLFNRVPKGSLAIVFDDRIISAPVVQASRFNGRAVISGSFSEEEAREIASVLKTDRAKSFIRIEKDPGRTSAPEKALEAVRGIKGLEKVTLGKGESGLEIGGFLTTDEIDVILLWQTLRDQGYRLGLQK